MPKLGITTDLVLECLDANSRGDGTLYAIIHQNKVLRNMMGDETLIWQGHHWEPDIMSQDRELVEEVAIKYLEVAREMQDRSRQAASEGKEDLEKYYTEKQKQCYKRASRLRSPAGVNACLDFAFHLREPLSISVRGDNLDQNPMLLGCRNGVLELDTGEIRPGHPGDLIVKSCPVDMLDIEAPCPTWEKFLWESLEDQPVIDFLQRFFGYCLTGLIEEQVFLILSGLGRNGKGVFIETILRILGPYAGPIQAEMLLDQGRQKSSSGPTPDIMSLYSRRLATASESDEARRFSPSRIKWFTGGDTLVGRNPHDKHERHFRPTHKLVLMTNNDPYAPADDFAFWSRLLKVDWPFQFVRNPRKSTEKVRDDHLMQKLLNELSGILAWLVRGNILWQRNGLAPPPSVREAAETYQREQDIVADFIEEKCVVFDDPETARTSGNDLYTSFSEWYQKYHRSKVPSITWFGRRMTKKFAKEKDGAVFYKGVVLAADN
ncbi:DNA primase family protein [Desulfonatronovibrio hydrogenovorans]|uniref:DNA primase family protein n=1 Tax=Desulfonatronovibrio hydrogenovorans TaxID=53245 RepID=UPI00068EE0AF|nr:phage/plasmid primase, P4 family [Desulfonatronovibrio hydrogenovorans]